MRVEKEKERIERQMREEGGRGKSDGFKRVLRLGICLNVRSLRLVYGVVRNKSVVMPMRE